LRSFNLSLAALVALAMMAGLARPAAARIDEFKLSAADDHHEIFRIDADTWRIVEKGPEPRNAAYVLCGKERALLFDSGSGRGIEGMVAAATRLPVTVLPSHLHAEHLGGIRSFDRVALANVEGLRSQARENVLAPTMVQGLSFFAPSFEVTDWLVPGSDIDLGGRKLAVVHTPGHTPESISLVDRASGQAFVGDLLFPGDVRMDQFGADPKLALASVRKLRMEFPDLQSVWGAHGEGELPAKALIELEQVLAAIFIGKAEGEATFTLIGMMHRYPGNGFNVIAK
jgi:hydroxyacylglutathione hydrolase